jgi:putative ABC transport system permease protein
MSPRWFENLKELFTQNRADADLERELRSHLEVETEEQLEKGVPPDEARYAAIRAIGNVPVIQEDTRLSWRWARFALFTRNLVTGVRQDLQYGLRTVRKDPAFTAAAVLALALGIGATTTIFSVIQNVLLDPYPMYRDVDRIVGVRIHDVASARPGGREYFQIPEFLEYQAQSTSFEEVIGGTSVDTVYTSPDGTEQFIGGLTTGNTFTFMGVSAFVGRTITMDDAKPGAPPVFVMTYKLWASRFGLDRGLIGRTFMLNGVPTTLIGVMPPRVSKLGADLWIPVRLDPGEPSLSDRYFRFQARLKPDVTIEQAEAEMNIIAQRLAKIYPRNYPPKFTVHVVGLIDSIVGRFRNTLYTMAAAVGLLLLIACANVANLLLSRAAGREREMALRASLGASRTRLVRQLLVESLLLALLGMIVGCAFSFVGIKLLVGAMPEGLIPRESLIRLDMTVLIFSLVVAALTAVLFGLAPALQTVKRDLVNPLRDAGKGTGGGFRRARLSSALVVAEIAMSLVLLTSAGLLMRSFVKLQTANLGLDPENVLFVRAAIGSDHQKTPAAQRQFLAQVLTRIRALPGVVSASTTWGFPVFGGFGADFDIPGVGHHERWRADVERCSEGYFRTLGMRLLQGRDFTADDMNSRRRVALVNNVLLERHLKGVDPIGRTIVVKLQNDERQLEDQAFEIVGVVADAKNNGITEPPDPEIFLPYSTTPGVGLGILVKTAVPPATLLSMVKQEIWSVDRSVAVAEGDAVTEYLKRFAYAEPRLGLFVFGAFAGIGLVLVTLGVYSVVAYTVARQTREIGIRMAIGANRLDVLRMTVGMGIRWIGFGVLAGLLVSLGATRLLASQLWEVGSTDPLTLATVISVVAISGLAASYFPALRATRVDPMVVLRYE